ncbi:LPS export ABC transporter periplasmic protein LptC [bacterium]|nr:LPS export ABC transporter periplasmic protein LptC [bacterium]
MILNFLKWSIVPLGAMLLFWGCSNSKADMAAFQPTEDQPIEQQKDLELVYSDSAITRMRLKAPEALNYPQIKRPKLEFPQGIDVIFFNAMGLEDSHLKADYAVRFPGELRWEASGNVVVTNRKGEKLETEHLVWDEPSERIYSEVFVKMTTAKHIILGEGFSADQNFTQYEINKVTGQIFLEE